MAYRVVLVVGRCLFFTKVTGRRNAPLGRCAHRRGASGKLAFFGQDISLLVISTGLRLLEFPSMPIFA